MVLTALMTLRKLADDYEVIVVDDGSRDGTEVNRRTDPLDPDSDDDGLSDEEELIAGTDTYITNPLNADSDGDAEEEPHPGRADSELLLYLVSGFVQIFVRFARRAEVVDAFLSGIQIGEPALRHFQQTGLRRANALRHLNARVQ